MHRAIDRERKKLNIEQMEYNEHYNYERSYGDIGYATVAKKYFNERNLKKS